MNVDSLFSLLRSFSSVAGIELTIDAHQGIKLAVVCVSHKRGAVHFVKGEYALGSYSQLKDVLVQGTPIALSIHGKGVMHRKPDEGFMMSLRSKPDDFYTQEFEHDGQTYLSLIKHIDLDSILSEFEQAGFPIVSLALGPFACLSILPRLGDRGAHQISIGQDKTVLQIDRHLFTYQSELLQDYRFAAVEKEKYSALAIDSEEMDERFFVAFAHAFCVIAEIGHPTIQQTAAIYAAAEYQQKLQFKRTARVSCMFVLAVLMLNYYLFIRASQQLEDTASAQYLQQKSTLAALREEVQRGDELFRDLNIGQKQGRAPLSTLLDKIGATLPGDLLLEEITVYPSSSSIGTKNKIPSYDFGTVHIKGECKEIINLHRWVKILKGLAISPDVLLENYANTDGQGKFFILMQL